MPMFLGFHVWLRLRGTCVIRYTASEGASAPTGGSGNDTTRQCQIKRTWRLNAVLLILLTDEILSRSRIQAHYVPSEPPLSSTIGSPASSSVMIWGQAARINA